MNKIVGSCFSLYNLSCIYTGDFFACDFLIKMDLAKLHLLNGGFDRDNWDLTDGNNFLKLFSYQNCCNWKLRKRIGTAIKNRSEISHDFALKRFRISLSEWKQLETVIFSSKVTFITMRIIIENKQLCHIHFYQKIARKKIARVNAALRWQIKSAEQVFNAFALMTKYVVIILILWPIAPWKGFRTQWSFIFQMIFYSSPCSVELKVVLAGCATHWPPT